MSGVGPAYYGEKTKGTPHGWLDRKRRYYCTRVNPVQISARAATLRYIRSWLHIPTITPLRVSISAPVAGFCCCSGLARSLARLLAASLSCCLDQSACSGPFSAHICCWRFSPSGEWGSGHNPTQMITHVFRIFRWREISRRKQRCLLIGRIRFERGQDCGPHNRVRAGRMSML